MEKVFASNFALLDGKFRTRRQFSRYFSDSRKFGKKGRQLIWEEGNRSPFSSPRVDGI